MDNPLGSFLCPPGYAGPRGLRAIAREGSAVSEAARFVRRSASDRLHRRETPYAERASDHGSPVVLVPGFLAGDGTLGLMARHLRGLGYRTYGSAIHANIGCTQEASEALERRIEAITLKRGRKVSIIGHSLGGLMARGLAARRPDLVAGIVTLGSPILAPGAAHPLLLFDLKVLNRLQRAGMKVMGEDCVSGDCARLSWEQSRAPLARGVAFTSVFSRRDGIVDWRSCLDPQARTVEVGTSHLGMAFDPVVLDVVTDTLDAARARHDDRVRTQARLSAVRDASAG
ncbi:MAG: alpha/beta fold hydrolase [Nocardioidaceae bacterium]|nr:alpha/beta fold hydrolase [Nocardioidaceae bacterium]NUS50051.1 alpha/beta fold hydrolase [Nocardioidaceae bacterium]